MKRNLKSCVFLETNADDHDLRIRTPPKQHSPEKIMHNEDHDLLSKFLKSLDLSHELNKFYNNEIQFSDLAYLSEQDYIELKLSSSSVKKIKQNLHTFQTSSLDLHALMASLKQIKLNFSMISDEILEQQLEILSLFRNL